MQGITTDNFLDVRKSELIRVQRDFGDISGMQLLLLDRMHQTVSEPEEGREGYYLWGKYVTRDIFDRLQGRIREGSLEELAVEDTASPNVKVASVAVKCRGRLIFSWMVIAVLKDEIFQEGALEAVEGLSFAITEEKFYRQLEFLTILSKRLVEGALTVSDRNNSCNEEIIQDRIMQKTSYIGKIIGLMDNNEAIEVVLHKALEIVTEYLEADGAQVYQLGENHEDMSVIADHWKKGKHSFLEKQFHIPIFSFLHGETPYVVSTNSYLTEVEKREVYGLGISALMAFPISVQSEKADMFLCVTELGSKRQWKVEEIQFMNEVNRLLRGILLRRIQRNSLLASYRSMEAVLEHIECGIYVEEGFRGKRLFVNRYMERILGEELSDSRFHELCEENGLVGRQSGFCEVLDELSGVWYSIHVSYITWVNTKKVLLFAVTNISEQKLLQKKMDQQIFVDHLTGLGNRQGCERDLSIWLDEAKQTNRTATLLCLDIDDFKQVNEALGHQSADILLKNVAVALRRVIGAENDCYRVGGDEFVLLIHGSGNEIQPVITRVMEIFENPWRIQNKDYYCSVCSGGVIFPSDGENVLELMRKADMALNEAKSRGMGKMCYYNGEDTGAAGRRLLLENNMRNATYNGFNEFEVFYQPLTDLHYQGTDQPHCCGAEALIRWNSKELGFVLPSDFIPLAEYLGLINPIGNYVLTEACRECRYWNDHGFPNYKINVNLSVVQLIQEDIVEQIEAAIHDTGINPENLTLEVTESLTIQDMERMKEVLARMKDLHCRIALDDFGTGYSSLNHIRELPFDVIKVDQSFIRDLADNAYSRAFVNMVAELAQALGKNICVEGVETAEQMAVLQEMKVQLIQGYYFGKPMPREEFRENFLKE